MKKYGHYFINSQRKTLTNFIIPLRLGNKELQEEDRIGNKTVSDVFEALIGAGYDTK